MPEHPRRLRLQSNTKCDVRLGDLVIHAVIQQYDTLKEAILHFLLVSLCAIK
jgi:hypothetical protein